MDAPLCNQIFTHLISIYSIICIIILFEHSSNKRFSQQNVIRRRILSDNIV